jgi:hypothetical protein
MESDWEFIKNVDAWLQAERENAQEAMAETSSNANAHVDSGLNILGINNSMGSDYPIGSAGISTVSVRRSSLWWAQPAPTARARLCAPGVLRRPPTWLDQLSPPPWSNTRRTTLGPAKDADNAMWSDDESDDEGTPGIPQPSYARRAIVPSPGRAAQRHLDSISSTFPTLVSSGKWPAEALDTSPSSVSLSPTSPVKLARLMATAPPFNASSVLTLSRPTQAFENTSISVAASQMRNALKNLTDSFTDDDEKARFETEMDILGIAIVSVR